MFEKMKEMIRDYRDRKGVRTGTIFESGMITAVSAGAAGSVAAVVTTPIDVIKTRIMLSAVDAATQGASSQQGTATESSKGLVDALGKTVESSKARTKSTVQNLHPMVRSERKGKKGAWSIGQDVLREKGFVGLWRGGALRGVWTFIGSGLYLGVYESGRVYLASRRGEIVDESKLL